MAAPDRKSPILITGCSSGLGQATARLLREAGYLTVATARDPSSLESLAAIGCETLQLDVADEASRMAAIAEIERRHGPVGVLINNAAYGQYGPLEEITQDDLRRSFETNVFGLLRMSQLVMPGMRSAGRGRIINISSLAGRVTAQGGGVYHMTKYAVEAIADAMRAEVKPFGVDLVSVLPGPFASPYRDKVIANIPDTGAGFAVSRLQATISAPTCCIFSTRRPSAPCRWRKLRAWCSRRQRWRVRGPATMSASGRISDRSAATWPAIAWSTGGCRARSRMIVRGNEMQRTDVTDSRCLQ